MGEAERQLRLLFEQVFRRCNGGLRLCLKSWTHDAGHYVQAKAHQPSIIFFDEIDGPECLFVYSFSDIVCAGTITLMGFDAVQIENAPLGLAPVRSAKQDQIHSSVVSTLLALMDGIDSRGQARFRCRFCI